MASASDVPAVWLRRLLRQVKEQARPRAFPPTGHPLTRPTRSGVWTGCGVTWTRRFSTRYDPHLSCRGLLRIATNWCTGEVADSPQVMGITDLRAHPGRILIVFGAPIAFAVTGFLHLVADGDAPGCQVWGRTAASRAGRANRGQRRPCQPHTSTRAPDDLSLAPCRGRSPLSPLQLR